MAKRTAKKLKPLKTLRRKLDRIFSEYIRRRDKGICCTCGKPFDWKYQGDAGHWVDRTHLATRYDERNCHFQCISCNRFHKPHDEYAAFMLAKYGQEVMDELRLQKRLTLVEFVNDVVCDIRETQGKYKGKQLIMAETTRDAYEFLIRYYQEKLEDLK